MPNNTNNIELRSDEVKDIIGRPPSKLLRYGIASVFIILLVLFVGSFFFKYPDVIPARLSLTGQNPPADIMARVNAKIVKLRIQDKQEVRKDERLAVLENPAKYQDLEFLKNKLQTLKNDSNYLNFEPDKDLQLGELQVGYSALLNQINNYRDFLGLDYHNKKISALEKQLEAYKESLQNIKRQAKLLRKDYTLAQKQYARDSALFSRRVIAEVEMENAQSGFLQKQMALESAINRITNLKIRVYELEQQILDLKLNQKEQKSKLEAALREQTENLQANIETWEYKYLLKSPISGKLSFTNIWSENQNVTAGETVFTVIPDGESRLIGHAQVPLAGAGKVKKGQKVNIKFDNFPETEYGIVRGKVESISLVQKEEFYTLRISFPDSLTTSYGKDLPFIQNMQGSAEIITEDIPLIVRMVNPLRDLFYNN